MEFVEEIKKYNIREIQNIAHSDTEAFYNYLEKVYVEDGVESLFFVVKNSGFYVDPFCNKLFSKQQERIKDLLKITVSPEELERFEQEVVNINFLNELSNDYNKKISELLGSDSNPQDSVAKIIYIANKFLEDMSKTILSKMESKMHNESLDDESELAHIENFFGHELNTENADDAFMGITLAVSEILKFLMFYKKNTLSKNSYNRIFPKKSLGMARAAIGLTADQGLINFFLSYWKYSSIGSEFNDNKLIFFISNDELNTYYNVKNSRTHLFANIMQSKIFKHDLEEESEINNRDFFEIDKENLAIKYHIDNFEKKIRNISLRDWLTAFNILQKECSVFIRRNRKKLKMNVSSYCLIKTEKEWERLFVKNGYTENQSKEIINFFTFEKSSDDLIDCPFIRIDDTDELLVIPQMVLHSYASNAVISNFSKKIPDKVSFRGFGFEKNVNELLNENGFKSSGIMQNYQGTTYECDVCFFIEDTIYFVECKSHSEPDSFDKIVNNISDLVKETNQVNRIAKHFEKHSNYVLQKLGLSEDTKINNVKKILLSATDLGKALYVNDVYITDYSTFSNFFLRNRIVIKNSNGEVRFRYHKDEYEGDINVRKFEKVLNEVLLEKEMLKNKVDNIVDLNINSKIKFALSKIDFANMMFEENDSTLEILKNKLTL